MDSSNPIFVNERITFEQMSYENIDLKRQDYRFLRELVEKEKRVRAPEQPGRAPMEVDKKILSYLTNSAALPVESGAVILEEGKITKKIALEDNPHRVFKPAVRDPEIIRYLLARNPELEKPIDPVVQTTGTKQGFKERLKIWMKATPVSVRASCKQWGLDPLKILEERLPVGKLVTWHGDYLDLIGEVTITKKSSAGPPYFKPKNEVWDAIVEDLGTLLDHFGKGTINKYLSENPAIIASECKNKIDRYKSNELLKKCRPYFSQNAPMQILFSFLSQRFTEGLKLFTEKGWNAYGFSLAKGGGSDLFTWMRKTQKGETKLAVYGDDVCLVWRDKGGLLWVVNPDFSSMDASVDEDVVHIVIQYILKSFQKQYGENSFWTAVAELWEEAAVRSDFWIDGIQMYGKKGSLRTGVVGTTLFDTAKSIISYEILLHKRVDLLDPDKVAKEFKLMGLTLKPDTWKPELVNELPEPGEFIFESKWLGVKFIVAKGKISSEPVPFMDQEDIAKLMGNPRYTSTGKMNRTQKQRAIFDCVRGYMFLAWHSENRDIWNAICDIVNDLDSEIIVQRVQAENGKGEKPELVALVGENFIWPTSDGIPSREFCKDVFLSPVNQVGGEWIHIFPDLKTELSRFRKQRSKVEVVELKPEESLNWRQQVALENVNTLVESVILEKDLPPVFADPTALTKKVKIDSKIEFKKPQTESERKGKIASLIDKEVLNAFKLDWAFICFPFYGNEFVFKTLREQGWFPHNGRIMRLEPTESYKKSEYKDVAYLLKDLKQESEVSVLLPKMSTVPGSSLISEVVKHLVLHESLDPVSMVTNAFNATGNPLTRKNEVISNSPNPLVEHQVFTKDGQFRRAATGSSSALARATLFSQLLEELRILKLKEHSEEKPKKTVKFELCEACETIKTYPETESLLENDHTCNRNSGPSPTEEGKSK